MLWFLCIAFPFIKIFLPMKFQVDISYSFRVMLRTKMWDADAARRLRQHRWTKWSQWVCHATQATRKLFHINMTTVYNQTRINFLLLLNISSEEIQLSIWHLDSDQDLVTRCLFTTPTANSTLATWWAVNGLPWEHRGIKFPELTRFYQASWSSNARNIRHKNIILIIN